MYKSGMSAGAKWAVSIAIILLIIGLFCLGVYIAALCKDLTWIEMFKEMFGIVTDNTDPETNTEALNVMLRLIA